MWRAGGGEAGVVPARRVVGFRRRERRRCGGICIFWLVGWVRGGGFKVGDWVAMGAGICGFVFMVDRLSAWLGVLRWGKTNLLTSSSSSEATHILSPFCQQDLRIRYPVYMQDDKMRGQSGRQNRGQDESPCTQSRPPND